LKISTPKNYASAEHTPLINVKEKFVKMNLDDRAEEEVNNKALGKDEQQNGIDPTGLLHGSLVQKTTECGNFFER